MGVSRISPPGLLTRLVARSMVKASVAIDRSFGATGAAAQGRADPGEELVHPEGLGDVVVGADVEGGDFGGLAWRADSTMIGTVVQPRRLSTTLHAVEVGQTQVDDRRGRVGCGWRREAGGSVAAGGPRSRGRRG